jgi:hypothetical protein
MDGWGDRVAVKSQQLFEISGDTVTRQYLQRNAAAQKQGKSAASVIGPLQEQAERLKVGNTTQASIRPAMPTFRGLSHELSGQVASPLVVQAKLKVGEPNDRYEREADAVAEQVVQQLRAPAPVVEGDNQNATREVPTLQAKPQISPVTPDAGGIGVSAEIEAAINQARGGGQPLPKDLQRSFGQAMDADLSDVRIHTDAHADVLNRSLGARAFTAGRDVFFERAEYSPKSLEGQYLLAHELNHVMQQENTGVNLIQRTAKQAFNYLRGVTSDTHFKNLSRKDKSKLIYKLGYQPRNAQEEFRLINDESLFSSLKDKRERAIKTVLNPGKLEAQYTFNEVIEMFKLTQKEAGILENLWDWKDPIKLRKKELEVDMQKERGRKNYSGLEQMQLIAEADRQQRDEFEDKLRQDFNSKRARIVEQLGGDIEGRDWEWKGRKYSLEFDYDNREIKHYDDQTAVSGTVAGRVFHGVTPKQGRMKQVKTGVGKAIHDIQRPDSEGGRKALSVALKSAALATSIFIPQLGAIIRSADQLLSSGVEDWLADQYQQYNAQIGLGDGLRSEEEAS